jgi:tetratricopeptide (TPR) repeat protein
MSQSEIDSSSHRLSRVPERYGSNRAIEAEKEESVCVAFFRSHPEAYDIRTPEEKLEELQAKLSDDLTPAERFTTLMGIKAAQELIHGENSVETLRAHEDLGIFYNDSGRSQSALRHLEKARQMSRTHKVHPNESMLIAVESAHAHMAMRCSQKANAAKCLRAADGLVDPYEDTEIDDAKLRFRRDLVKARIRSARRNYQEALVEYDKAASALDAMNNGGETVETAKLHIEIGDMCGEIGRAHV